MNQLPPNFIFLARHSNDIDHAVPVIWGLLRKGIDAARIRYIALFPDPSIDPSADARLRFLASLGITLEEPHLRTRAAKSLRWLGSHAPAAWIRRHVTKFLYRQNAHSETNIDAVLTAIGDSPERTVIVSDHHNHPVLQHLRQAAQQKKAVMVALPHGFQLHRGFSDPATQEALGENAMDGASAKHFDQFLMCAAPDDARNSGKVLALGTPRFSPEWLEVLSQIYPVAQDSGTRLKVLFLLEKAGTYAGGRFWEWIDTEQQFAALRFLAEHPGIELRIKGNARGIAGRQAKLLRPYRHALADDACPTNPLITWADLVVGCCSSVVMDAYVRDKPVLLLEYATRLKMVFKEFGFLENPGSHARFTELVNKLIERRGENLYDPALLQRLIRHYVYAGKEPHSVVDAYAEFLISLAN